MRCEDPDASVGIQSYGAFNAFFLSGNCLRPPDRLEYFVLAVFIWAHWYCKWI